MDLDGFKAVNDTYGHPVGDRLLCIVASALEKAAPSGSVVARLGGDEFGIVHTAREGDAQVSQNAQRLVTAVRNIREADGCRVDVSASIGVVQTQTGSDAEAIQQAADRALYRAKRLGKNRFVIDTSLNQDSDPKADTRMRADAA